MQSLALASATSLDNAFIYAFMVPLSFDMSTDEQERVMKSSLKNLPPEYQKLMSAIKKRINEML